jgi:hypothetical protein
MSVASFVAAQRTDHGAPRPVVSSLEGKRVVVLQVAPPATHPPSAAAGRCRRQGASRVRRLRR